LSPDFLSSMGSTSIDGFGLGNPLLTGEADPGNPKKDYYPNRLVLLDEAAKTLVILLQMAPGATVEIWGHADATGEKEQNITLAQQRADFVRTHLILAGVTPDIIQTHSAGSSQPVVKTTKPEPQNRRVEIRFKPGLQPTVSQTPQTSPLIPAPRLTWPGQGEKP
jgi:OmpA family